MKQELTTRELETLEYRKKRLRRKLERLELLLSGGGSSPCPLVRGAQGGWAEERGRALIRALLETLDLNLRGQEAQPEEPCPLSQLSPVLTEEQRTLFESFFYCTLRALEAPVPSTDWSGPLDGTWIELLTLARETPYSDRYTLYFDELYQAPAGIFHCLDQMYETLTGEAAVRRASPEDIQTVRERFQKEIAELDSIPAWEELPEEIRMEFSEPFSTEDQAEAEEQAAALAAWRDGFRERETFCREYLRFREMYFGTDVWRHLGDWTEQTVDLYLYREGSSGFLTDDRYFLAYGLLDRAARQLQSAVEEG